MAVVFRDAVCPPLQQFNASAPDGAVIGLIGHPAGGVTTLLHLAAGLTQPESGAVEARGNRRLISAPSSTVPEDAAVVAVEYALDVAEPLERFQLSRRLEDQRRRGASILIASHHAEIITALCDEAWWISEGRLALRAHPAEAAEAYARDTARRIRELGAGAPPRLEPSLRRGDGRAELIRIALEDDRGTPVSVWRSGETAVVRVRVRFHAPVEDPVVGIMIRTRVGLEVYGTNTELEGLKLGPRAAGDEMEIEFRFQCELCPRDYILTAASHDPDGVWHDWMEDAVAFAVTDSRYTAGVANLRARVAARAVT